MTTTEEKDDESPLKPVPIKEVLAMFKENFIKRIPKIVEPSEPDNSAFEDFVEPSVGEVSINLSEEEDEPGQLRDEPDCTASNEYLYGYKYHDLSTIKEQVNNDSGYSSTTNRTSTRSSYNRLSAASTCEISSGVNELSIKKNQEFLTPAQRPYSSAIKSANSSKFSSFVAPNKTEQLNRPLFRNHEQLNTAERERVLYQFTPSSKLQYSNNKIIKKSLFIPPVITPILKLSQNNDQKKQFNDSIPNVGLSDISAYDLASSYEFITVKQSKYIKGNLIGRGGSCHVYHCFDPVQKVSRAIKIVDLKQNEDTAALYRNEVMVLQRLQNSGRVVKLYDYETDELEGLLYMVLEMGGKDLDKILKQLSENASNLPFYKILYYWMEMLYCVRDIHKIGIVHSDLKPANFLMAESGIKLIDFGIASHLQTDMTSVLRHSAVGSLNYISPEALKCDNATLKYKIKFKSDIWSLGCILYQLVYKKAPFQHISNMWAKMEAITNKNHQIEYPHANRIHEKTLKTIQKCLQFDANLRPTIDELIAEYKNSNFV